ncbi:ADP-forming succinate--CoA ligase subunit beta [Mesorhizobium ventifaucium]|uniref:Succinate--CoA ligase (ADP-forming) subunit beta n=1 Tax=Mesorhizobium ventifaucium TaxID=666020 RepID=A0ABN8K8D4_9HYPH|nr:ADP-forming succinate--CoA ligase subunit beta [Mesorhizobium ventifaucium]CAH2405660.1 Succinate--CoA ligase (ADP-forming) subunit beta [Mesorhizobium ventifaucium]
MNLHEFQSKILLSSRGVHVPEGKAVSTKEEARDTARDLKAAGFAVKAQIRAGARGRAGGVRLVSLPEEAMAAAGDLLGRRLATEQTAPTGHLVRKVLVETAVEPLQSLYLSLFIGAATAEIVLLAACEGGDDIEQRIQNGQTRFERLALGAEQTLDKTAAAGLGARLGLAAGLIPPFVELLGQLRDAFLELDATLIEINPLAVVEPGRFVAVDAKITIDDNALFRHPDLMALREESESDAVEVAAQNRNLNYLALDGDIGLVVNGAGLGLATLDMVRAANGRPANFMDIRTTATSLDVAHGFALLLGNPAVRSILVNVHGGGMQPCDTIADGLGIAMRRNRRSLPIVVRLAGNNAEYARFRFANFGCKVIDCPDMWTAVTRAVSAAQSGESQP